MEILCSFDYSNGYRCFVRNHQIPEGVELKFVGTHQAGKTDDDVKCIFFHECKITKVPKGLTKIFRNLEILQINFSDLKNVSRSDLIEYKNFKEFNFYGNNIEYLPGDLFEDFDNLERIFLQNNNFKIVEPNILDGLENLKIFIKNGEQTVQLSVLCLDENARFIKSSLLNNYMQNDQQMLKDFIANLQTKVQIVKNTNKI